MSKQFVVIGLGRFGGSVAKTLNELGYNLIAIDIDEHRVQDYCAFLPYVYQADSTDERVLKELGVTNFDHAIVSIGNDLQASILTTLILKDLGVKEVSAKATSNYHKRVLLKIGADHIVLPEHDSGVRMAHQVTSSSLIDYLELSPEYSLVEISAPPSMDRQSLKELNLRAKYGCNVVAIKKENNDMVISPLAEERIGKGDVLVVIGENKDIGRFEKELDI